MWSGRVPARRSMSRRLPGVAAAGEDDVLDVARGEEARQVVRRAQAGAEDRVVRTAPAAGVSSGQRDEAHDPQPVPGVEAQRLGDLARRLAAAHDGDPPLAPALGAVERQPPGEQEQEVEDEVEQQHRAREGPVAEEVVAHRAASACATTAAARRRATSGRLRGCGGIVEAEEVEGGELDAASTGPHSREQEEQAVVGQQPLGERQRQVDADQEGAGQRGQARQRPDEAQAAGASAAG